MTKPARPKSNTVTAAVEAMVNAAKPPHKVPKHVFLRDEDKPFWDGILLSRSRDEWTEADLVVAAQLARCQQDIERESRLLYEESAVVTNARGTQIMNPRVTVLEQLARREMAMMRSLRMGGQIAGGRGRDMDKTRTLERVSRSAREQLQEDDDLIAA